MRVTRAGSWATILWSWLAVLLGSSTVETMRVVISGRVAIVLTFLTAAATMALVSEEKAAAVVDDLGSASVAVDIELALTFVIESGGRELNIAGVRALS